MMYIYKPRESSGQSGFSTRDKALFTAHLLTLDDWGKEDVLMAFWDSIGVEDCCGGDCLGSISADVIRWGDKLYEIWMDNLINDMEELVECDGDSMTRGVITVEYEEEED